METLITAGGLFLKQNSVSIMFPLDADPVCSEKCVTQVSCGLKMCLEICWRHIEFCCMLTPDFHKSIVRGKKVRKKVILPCYSTKMYIVSVVFRHIYNIFTYILYIVLSS